MSKNNQMTITALYERLPGIDKLLSESNTKQKKCLETMPYNKDFTISNILPTMDTSGTYFKVKDMSRFVRN